MGTIRVLLALVVVIAHSEPLFGIEATRLCGGMVAVQLFYITSGFYMSLILSGRYAGPGGARRFYASRFFRLFPAYWLTLAGTLAALFVCSRVGLNPAPLSYWRETTVDQNATTALAVTSVAILGQDALMFTGLDANGSLYLTRDMWAAETPTFRLMPAPQCWTISLELMFYALAPWLVRRNTATLLWIIAACLAVRHVMTFRMGFDHDPWTYRFFPFELPLFLLGMIAHRIHPTTNQDVQRLAWLGCLAVIIGWRQAPTGVSFGGIQPFYFAFAACLPLIFALTRDWKWDQHIGELSYPIYLTHWIVSQILQAAEVRPLGLWTMGVTLVLSAGLVAVQSPIDSWRHRWLTRRDENPSYTE